MFNLQITIIHKFKNHSFRNRRFRNCRLGFTTRQNLKKHFETVNEGIKPFKCSICDAEFANKQNLKKHRKILVKDSNHSSAVIVMLSLTHLS